MSNVKQVKLFQKPCFSPKTNMKIFLSWAWKLNRLEVLACDEEYLVLNIFLFVLSKLTDDRKLTFWTHFLFFTLTLSKHRKDPAGGFFEASPQEKIRSCKREKNVICSQKTYVNILLPKYHTQSCHKCCIFKTRADIWAQLSTFP